MKVRILLLSVILLLTFTAAAQEGDQLPPVTAEIVNAEAADGLTLVGDYFQPSTEAIPVEGAPAVLLLHMNNGRRGDWALLVPALVDAGYAVLAVDMRGFGETGGDRDWEAAIGDVATWLEWLRSQPIVRADAVSIVGASIGSNLTLVGCANDELCVTAVALSPGLDYFGVMPEDSVTGGLRNRSALLLSAYSDSTSRIAITTLATSARGEVGLHLYRGSRHGTDLLLEPFVVETIVAWLDQHLPAPTE